MLIRAFFAIDLPDDTKQSIRIITQDLVKRFANNEVRWVEPSLLHITLQFLEKMDMNTVDSLLQNTQQALNKFKPFELTLGAPELFPTPRHPHIISMPVGPQIKLVEISHAIGSAMAATHYKIEEHPFRGHLTLGRLHIPITLPSISFPPLEKITVNEIILYQSKTFSTGSRYTALGKIKLM